jgi:hypothetical protein
MELLRLCLRYAHLLGFAVLFGTFLAQYLAGRFQVGILMRAGLGVMIVSGLLLALPFPPGKVLDYNKIGVKMAIALVILFAMDTGMSGQKVLSRNHFLLIGAAILVNAGVAVFWR